MSKETVHVLLQVFSLKNTWALKYGLRYSSLVPPSETNAAHFTQWNAISGSHSQIVHTHKSAKKKVKISNKNKSIQGKAKY